MVKRLNKSYELASDNSKINYLFIHEHYLMYSLNYFKTGMFPIKKYYKESGNLTSKVVHQGII